MKQKIKKVIKVLLVLLAVIVVAAGLFGLWAAPYIRQIANLHTQACACVRDSSEETFQNSQTSEVYDVEGNLLFRYSGEKDMAYVPVEQIPQVLIDAFVVMEDQNFYEHRGVDYKAVVRAALENYRAKTIVQGASTITQQLARNIFLTQDVEYSRKIEEIFIADQLEQKYTKDQIMEFYLNNIYFGNGFYGVGAAAMGYFGKDVAELTMGECILLSAVPNNPSRYELFSNEEAAVERAGRILLRLYQEGKISELDYLLYGTGEGNPFLTANQLEKMKRLEDEAWDAADGYLYTYVTNCAVKYLMNANGFGFRYQFTNDADKEAYDAEYEEWYKRCQQWLYTGGYQIYTAIDMKAQHKLLEIMDEKLSGLDKEDGTLLQGGAICIDNSSGLVVAVIGGRSEGAERYGFNRAYQSYRQPGSTIKPLNVYTPYLYMGHSPLEKVQDVYDPSGPRNAGNAYAGEMTLEEAVIYSKNTVAWQIYKEMTPERGMDFLFRLGFKKVWMDRTLAAGALGGFTYGVSVEEMAGGYAALANDGVYRVPTCIQAIYNRNGKRIGGYEEAEVYSQNASRLMTEMLQKVVEEGTGKRAALAHQASAGKTGTTNSNKDAWFVGYTPYYTTSVWSGYDIPEEIDLSDGNVSCDIWHDFMEYMHQNLSYAVFPSAKMVQPVERVDETKTEESLENWMETEEELTLPTEEELTLPTEEELTLPAEEELTLPTEEELTLPAEEELTLPPGME